MANGHYVIPKLVEDASLKRARTTITEGGEEKEVIQVTQVGGSGGLDSQGVADAMGKQASEVLSGSVISSLQQGLASDIIRNSTLVGIETNTDVLGATTDAEASYTDPGTINARLRYVSDMVDTIETDASTTCLLLGNKGTAAWSGSGDANLNAITKRTSNDAHATAEVLGTQSDMDVFPNRDGSINGRVRYISNAITTIDSNNYKTAEATGTQSDAAWSGSGDGTVIALLKGIYNKL